jgi:hypothetical protein
MYQPPEIGTLFVYLQILNDQKTMKKGSILFGVGFLLITLSGYAQDYAFKVLANKGANEYKSSEGWQPIKTGAVLKLGDELKISENAYLGLVYNTGKPLEVKKSGSYKVSDLAKEVGPGTSVLNKYTDFILSSNSAEAKKNRLSATGAVHRGEPTMLNVFLPPPQNAGVYGKVMVVEWETPKSGGPYVVILKDIYEEEIARFETPETLMRIDMADAKFPKLATELAILVEVASKADAKTKSEGKVVKKLDPATLERVKKAYAEIAGEIKEETAFDKFIQAGFFEQNGLLIDALTSYEESIRLAPDVDDFRTGRDEFLYRNKLATQKP